MYQFFRTTIVAVGVICALPASTSAQVAVTQVMLSEKHIEGFISVQKDMADAIERMQGTAFSDPANAKYKAQLRASTKKRGFKNFAEYEAVAASISAVITAIDPQTKEFTDPQSAIRQDLENVTADQTITDKQKKQLLRDLNTALKSTQPIQFPTNVELVKKYYDKIDVTMIASYDGESRGNSSAVRTISE